MSTQKKNRALPPRGGRPGGYNGDVMKCPICKAPVDEATAGQKGSFFPFCSDRCKTIDLARWLDGAYQIPVRESGDEFDGEPPGRERKSH